MREIGSLQDYIRNITSRQLQEISGRIFERDQQRLHTKEKVDFPNNKGRTTVSCWEPVFKIVIALLLQTVPICINYSRQYTFAFLGMVFAFPGMKRKRNFIGESAEARHLGAKDVENHIPKKRLCFQ